MNANVGGWGYSTQVIESITGEQSNAYKKLIAECETQPIWGMKHPRLCFVSQFIWPLLDDPRAVFTRRPFIHTAKSLVRYSEINLEGRERMSLDKAVEILHRWKRAYDRRLAEFTGPAHHVGYYTLLDDPEGEIRKLQSFCFGGSDAPGPNESKIDDAVKFIERGLRHF